MPSFAMPETVLDGSPPELATPALSKRTTGRSFARPSVTLGSQLSRPPRKCCRNTTGIPLAVPNHLYAYLTPLALMNYVGAVLWVLVIFHLRLMLMSFIAACTSAALIRVGLVKLFMRPADNGRDDGRGCRTVR